MTKTNHCDATVHREGGAHFFMDYEGRWLEWDVDSNGDKPHELFGEAPEDGYWKWSGVVYAHPPNTYLGEIAWEREYVGDYRPLTDSERDALESS